MVAPVLLSEISSDENRGTITTTHQLMVTIGILAASLIGYGFVTTTEHGWQYAQLFILLPSVLQIAMAAYLPESPRWLCQQGRIEEARSVVEMLRFSSKTEGDDLALDSEINAMILESDLSSEASGSGGSTETPLQPADEATTSSSTSKDKKEGPTWSEVFSHKKAMVIGLTLMSMMSITGMSALIFYSTTIFGYAGVKEVGFLFFPLFHTLSFSPSL